MKHRGVAPLAFGCGANAGLMVSGDTEQQREVVGAALRHDVRLFDTAPAYGAGTSESNLGAALRHLGADDVDIFTKVLLSDDELDDIAAGVVGSVTQSLKRIGFDTLAGITLHNRIVTSRDPARRIGTGPVLSVDDVLGPAGVVDGLRTLQSEGRVGHIGFTTVGGDRAAVDAVVSSGAFDFINTIYGVLGDTDRLLPILEGDASEDVIDVAANAGLAVLALRVFGGGLLFAPEQEQAPMVSAFTEWCEDHGMAPSVGALRYAFSRPAISSVVLGFTRPEHVVAAVGAFADGPLSAFELDSIAQLQRDHGGDARSGNNGGPDAER